MLINYGKLIPWESQYCVKIKTKRIMTFIQENAAAISVSGYYQYITNISFMQEK